VSAPIHEIFGRLRAGDDSALGELTPTLYEELRRIASRHLRNERPGHTLQPTALVHEAYLKLFDGAPREYADEVHFLAVASRVMRQVLVDYARARARLKRSAGPATLEVNGDKGVELLDLIELDAAIDALAAEDRTIAQLVEMRYFGGMTAEESADALGVSVHVVRHDLRFAQAWLRRRLTQQQQP
jgi:RNA polymerase sigma factor (TIGR02999 family)